MADPYRLVWADKETLPGSAAVQAGEEKYWLLAAEVNDLRDRFNEVVDKAALKWQIGYEARVCWYPAISGEPEFYYSVSDLAQYSMEQPGTGGHWIRSGIDGGTF